MKKLIAIFALSVVSMFGQTVTTPKTTDPTLPTLPSIITLGPTSIFETTGVSFGGSEKSVLFGLGVSQRIAAKQSIVADFSTSISRGTSGVESIVIVGMKQDLGTVTFKGITFKPFTMAGYGATIKNAIGFVSQLNASSFTGISTAVATNAVFTQQYAVGATILLKHGISLGLGYKEQKAASVQAYGYPFMILGLSF